MKWRIFTACSMLICLITVMSVPVYAQEALQEGCEGEIYYQIIEVESDTNSCAVGETITLSRKFVYDAILTPSKTMYYTWRDYAGYLNLQEYYQKDGQTHAIYFGTLYLRI